MTSALATDRRTDELHAAGLNEVYVRQSRLLGWLMAIQWLAGLLIAFTLSPHAWQGKVHTTHAHVWTALVLGGLLSVPTIALAITRPGWVVTRHAMAVAQMGWSALLIHLTGGRLETHFHVFGSLAFIAFYRDWKVLLTATLVVASEHLVRSLTWPESVFGITNPEWWRFLEHAWWVVFENVVLFLLVRDGVRELRRVARSRALMEHATETVEAKVLERTAELLASREQLRLLMETTRTVPWRLDIATHTLLEVGAYAGTLLGCDRTAWLKPTFLKERLHPDDLRGVVAAFTSAQRGGGVVETEARLLHDDGSWVWVRSIIGARDPQSTELKGILLDVTHQRLMLSELNQAQKLESVGRLASGIAHELNTPIQFVNDSIHFISDAFSDLFPLLAMQQSLHQAASQGLPTDELVAQVTKAEGDADLEYLLENVPRALERSVEGLERVATLVRSMKEFAHPEQKEKAPADLKRALESTLVIARNEVKYVADVQTDFEVLPLVTCHLSELNQVFLNIIVNAAHAIGDRVKGTSDRGLIRVRTRALDGQVEVSISDTGGGIPEAIRHKVFEPFFTTKEVGRGTGQGLAIARSVVVEKHQGTLTFDVTPGVGTTFFIRIPCAGLVVDRASAA